MATINLGLRLNSNKLEKLKLENIDLNKKVNFIKEEVLSRTKFQRNIVLVHCGVILNGNETLSEAGLSSGSLIHCLPKKDADPPAPVPLSIMEVQQLLVNLRTVVANQGFRPFIQKLRGPELTEKVMKACPYVRRDPSALAFLQDPDLFLCLVNPDELTKIVEQRPVIGRLAQYVVTLISSESTSRSHHVSYSLDALSDDEEEMDAEQSGDSTAGSRASGSVPYQPITPSQLAAALANATGGAVSRSTRSIPTTPSSAATPFNTPGPPSASGGATASPGGMITSEMFSQALQNALAASASRGAGPLSSSPSSSMVSSSATGPALENLEESLQLMREMGIVDEQMSLRALQATNGDVQAAVNLIFAQLLADD